jgi:hypothetical protein
VAAAGRGVRVVLLLQGRMDHPLLHYASHALYGSFLDSGIEIHEYQQCLLHAKVAVIDGHWATVGSSNLDPFSLLLSLEANVVIDDEGFANELKFSLEQAMETGAQRIGENNWRTQSIGQRLASWLSYGVVRFMIGIAGYAPGKLPGRAVPIDHGRLKNGPLVAVCATGTLMKTDQDIKSAATIDAMIHFAETLLGIRFTRVRKNRYSALCPFHADTKDRFMVYVNKNDEVRFHCFGACKGDWDIYDLIMLRMKYPFRKAQQVWAEHLGLADFTFDDGGSPVFLNLTKHRNPMNRLVLSEPKNT